MKKSRLARIQPTPASMRRISGGRAESCAQVRLTTELEPACTHGDGHLIGSVSGTPVTHGAAFDAQHGVVYAPAAAGLLSFAPGACEPPPDGLRFAGGMSFFLAPLLAFALFLYLYARHRRRGGPKRLTYEELRKQDMETERERMLELEDSILGPVNQEWRPEA